MEIKRVTVKSCSCSKPFLIFQIDQPLLKNILIPLKEAGFSESAHFTKAGILYVENCNFIVTGPFGGNKLQIKCKVDNCQHYVDTFESWLRNLF
jgi:hypothetical protein